MARFALLALLPTAFADLEKALSQDIVSQTHDLTTQIGQHILFALLKASHVMQCLLFVSEI